MDATYKIIGSDGREYGPVNLEQMRAWAGEGRVMRDTQVSRSDQSAWIPAAQMPELGFSPAPSRMQPIVVAAPEIQAALERRVKGGASWFYWIAGLSLVNSIAALAGSGWRFIIGLGVTQFIDAIGQNVSSSGGIVAFILSVIVAGVFVLFGVFAGKRHLWAFIIGMVLYALDGLLLLLVADWLSIGFHVFALYCIYKGLQAHNQLRALEGN